MQDLAKQRHAGCCFLEAVDGRRFAQDNATLTLGRDEMELIAKLVRNRILCQETLSGTGSSSRRCAKLGDRRRLAL